MKFWKRVIENKLRDEITILENRFGFMTKQSTIKAIFLFKHLMDKYRERQMKIYIWFLLT